MNYLSTVAHSAGYAMFAAGMAWGVALYGAHPAIPGAGVPTMLAGSPEAAESGGEKFFWLGVTGLATVIGDRLVSYFKNRNDLTQKIAASEDRVAAKVAEALRVKDAETSEKFRARDAETSAVIAKLNVNYQSARARREAEREFQNAKTLALEAEIRDLKAFSGRISGKAERVRVGINANSEAITGLAEGTHISVTPAVEIADGDGELDHPEDAIAGAMAGVTPVDPSLPRLLVVEDTDSARVAMGRVLKSSGFDAVLVPTGVEASTQIRSTDGRFDAILLDLKLPDVSGVEVIRLVRENRTVSPKTGLPVRVVVYTGCDKDDEMIVAAIDAGADAVVIKPADFDDLAEVLKGRAGDDIPGTRLAIPGRPGSSDNIQVSSPPTPPGQPGG